MSLVYRLLRSKSRQKLLTWLEEAACTMLRTQGGAIFSSLTDDPEFRADRHRSTVVGWAIYRAFEHARCLLGLAHLVRGHGGSAVRHLEVAFGVAQRK